MPSAATIEAPSGYKIAAQLVQGHTFTLSNRYNLREGKILGKGSFGLVTSADDTKTRAKIAVKRIRPYANDEWDARHTLREIRLMRLLDPHPNIISLYDVSLWDKKTELYLMMELMDCDLHKVIQSKQSLTENHYKCFIKQLLEGVKTMHAMGIFHRDLKPGNILVSRDCQLRITDFGLARYMHDETLVGENEQNPMTEYVVTRWYRAPELLLAPSQPYGAAIDLWSVGCILAELILRKPLFPGKSHAQQVSLVFEVLGYTGPAGSDGRGFGFPLSQEAVTFLSKRCAGPGKGLAKCLPGALPTAVALITCLLAVSPQSRPTAVQALESEYLQGAEVLYKYSEIDAFISQDIISQGKVNAQFFDFERDFYSTEQLIGLIHREVGEHSRDLVQGVDEAQTSDDAMEMSETPRATTAVQASAHGGASRAPSAGAGAGAGAGDGDGDGDGDGAGDGAGDGDGGTAQQPEASGDQERVTTAPAVHTKYNDANMGEGGVGEGEMDVDGDLHGAEPQRLNATPHDGFQGGIPNANPHGSLPTARSKSASSMSEGGQTSPHRMGSIVRKGNKVRALQRADRRPVSNAGAVSRAAPAAAGRGMVISRSVLNNAEASESDKAIHGAAKARGAAGGESATTAVAGTSNNAAVLRALRGSKAHTRTTNPTTSGAASLGQGQTQVQAQGVYNSSGGILRSLQTTLSGLRGKSRGESSGGAGSAQAAYGQPPVKRPAIAATAATATTATTVNKTGAGGGVKRPTAAPSGRTAVTGAGAAPHGGRVLPSVNR